MELAPEHNATTPQVILNTLEAQKGRKPPTNEQNTSTKPIGSEQRTGRGVRAPSVFTLQDLERMEFSLDNQHTLNAQDATNEQFSELANEVATVTDVKEWYLEERRDFINGLYAFCEEHPALPFPFTIVDEAKTPTAPLSAEKEDTGFLSNVERARPIMEADPGIDAKELAEALGLKSVIYAQTVKVYVNADKEHTHAE